MPMHMPINSEDIWYLLKMYILFSIPLLFIFWIMLWTKRCNMSAVRAGERYGNAAVIHKHFVIYKNVEEGIFEKLFYGFIRIRSKFFMVLKL